MSFALKTFNNFMDFALNFCTFLNFLFGGVFLDSVVIYRHEAKKLQCGMEIKFMINTLAVLM